MTKQQIEADKQLMQTVKAIDPSPFLDILNDFDEAVSNYVHKTFKKPYFHTEPCGLLPHGIRVIDKTGDECLVYWNHLKCAVDVVFPDMKVKKHV